MARRAIQLLSCLAASAFAAAPVGGRVNSTARTVVDRHFGAASVAPGGFETAAEGTSLPLLWSATSSSTDFDAGRLVSHDAAGNVYMAGTAVGDVPNLTMDMHLVKYDPLGQVVWTLTWRGYPEAAADDVPHHVRWAPDGTLVIVGDAGTLGGAPRLCVLKIDQDGAIVWSRIWENPFDPSGFGHATGRRVDIGPDGSIYAMAGNFELVKYSSNGTLEWGRKDAFINYDDWFQHESISVAMDTAGNAFVAGWTRRLGTNQFAFTAVGYTSQGDTIWATRTTDVFRTKGMVLDGAGGLFAVGQPTPTATSETVLVKHLTVDGTRVFRQPVVFQGATIAAVQLVRDAADRPVLLGFLGSVANTMVFDPSGQTVWGVTDPTMAPIRVNTNAQGDIALVGSIGSGFDTGLRVVVYSGAGEEYGSAVFDEVGTSEVPAWVDADTQHVYVSGEIRPPVPQALPVSALTQSYLFVELPPSIFTDGFESGDTSSWSLTVP